VSIQCKILSCPFKLKRDTVCHKGDKLLVWIVLEEFAKSWEVEMRFDSHIEVSRNWWFVPAVPYRAPRCRDQQLISEYNRCSNTSTLYGDT
jgi:hypothetical protein